MSAANFRNGNNNDLSVPMQAAPVTLSDTVDLDFYTRGIYVGTAGDVKVTTSAGMDVTLKNLAAGIIHVISVRRIWSTGTTAIDVVALF